MHFGNPEYLYLLFVLPVLLFLFMRRLSGSRRQLSAYMGLKCLYAIAGSLFSRRRVYRYCVLLLSLMFLVLALARPQGSIENEKVEISGVEVMIVADVSRSMLVEDMGGVSRLTVMKKELRRLLNMLPGQRVGLIAFAGTALLVSPLTLDHSILDTYINSLSANTLFVQGTDFGVAFRMAWQAFRRGGVSDASQGSRAVIVASDGEDNEQQAVTAARELSQAGIRIFTIGVGSASGGPVPIYDTKANKIGYKKDDQGNLIVSHFEDQSLKAIARITKGSFYHLSAGDHSVENIYSDIQSLEQGKTSYVNQTNYKEWYGVFVLLALLCGSVYFLMSEKTGSVYAWHSYLKNQ